MPRALIVSLLALSAQLALAENTLTLVDSAGKTQTIKAWSWASGTQELAWQAKGKQPGPQALAFREKDSTTFREGILTLVPVESIRSLTYDYPGKTAVLRVATSADAKDDVVLKGTATVYVGFNTVSLAAEVDKGGFGVAEVKYAGGSQGGFRSATFSAPKPLAAPSGRRSRIQVQGADASNEIWELQALYRAGRGAAKLDLLFFRKTLKVPLSKISKLAPADRAGRDWKLALPGGADEIFTLMTSVKHGDQQLSLRGLVGRVKAGYRLYPLYTITSCALGLDDKPVEKKPEEKKPVEDKPEDAPAEDKPAEDKPAEDKPAEDKPAEDE